MAPYFFNISMVLWIGSNSTSSAAEELLSIETDYIRGSSLQSS